MSALSTAAAPADVRALASALDRSSEVGDASGETLPDLSENLPRRIGALARPGSVEEVQRLVRAAAGARIALYPVSTGRNWGLGTNKPVLDDCALIDLSRMNRIRALDLERGYAVIEPGVSQAALAQRLEGTPFLLNVTTSCRDSSVLGNALERGEGVFRPRLLDLLGLEAVLGNGDLLATGGAELNGSRRYDALGAGPDLTGVFLQSNFGIVTAAAIALIPRPQCIDYVYARFSGRGSEALRALIDAMAQLFRERVVSTTFRISEFRIEPRTAGHLPEFAMLGSVLGPRALAGSVEAILRETLSALGSCTALRIGACAELLPDDALYGRARLFLGTPGCELLRARFGTRSCAIDEEARIGWTVLCHALPFDGSRVLEAVGMLQQMAAAHELPIALDLSMVSGQAINLMSQIWFERTPAAIERMRTLRDALHAELCRRGFPSIRNGIDTLRAAHRAGAAARATPLQALRQAFDPQHIISPGRYV